MKFMKTTIFIFIAIFFASCSKNNHIERDKFVDIYAETLIISANTSLDDSKRKEKIDSLMNINNLTAEDFKYTVSVLSENPVEWKDIYKEVMEKIELKKQR